VSSKIYLISLLPGIQLCKYKLTGRSVLLSQLIRSKCGDDLTLVEEVVGYLMGRLVDPCITVRMLCVRGLGNIAETGDDMVSYIAPMLSVD